MCKHLEDVASSKRGQQLKHLRYIEQFEFAIKFKWIKNIKWLEKYISYNKCGFLQHWLFKRYPSNFASIEDLILM